MLICDELCCVDQVHKWLTWAYWTSPMMYIQTAISVNEFGSMSWKDVISLKPFLNLSTHFVKSKLYYVMYYYLQGLGVAVLKSRGFFVEAYWYWIGLLALIISTVLSNIITSLCLAFLKRECPHLPILHL